jgi:hypothetical protein
MQRKENNPWMEETTDAYKRLARKLPGKQPFGRPLRWAD